MRTDLIFSPFIFRIRPDGLKFVGQLFCSKTKKKEKKEVILAKSDPVILIVRGVQVNANQLSSIERYVRNLAWELC